MTQSCELFHGSPASGILAILEQGTMRPDANHQIFFSQRFEDTLQHGADLEAGASFAFKAEVTLPAGASLTRTAKPGNPVTVLITSALPVPVRITELYVRTGRTGEFELKIVKGPAAIRAFLLKAARTGAGG